MVFQLCRFHFHLIILASLILSCCISTAVIAERSSVSILHSDILSSSDFREQDLSPALYSRLIRSSVSSDWTEALTATMLNGHFHPQELSFRTEAFLKYKREEYELLHSAYAAIWKDLKFFPVADSRISFEDSWMKSPDCMGSSQHEGTDLFGRHSEPGFYPVISMTDGIITEKEWQTSGGYVITVSAGTGSHFYYAHLDSYEKDLHLNDPVRAGDILGYMGNSGFCSDPAVTEPPAQLHLGICLSIPSDTISGKENTSGDPQYLTVDPFPILLCLRKNIRNYSYS